ncbi:DUF6264 family protein [Curtobacterium aurantiacum]|uniref:DUF6264 family protein n=1 Tax=Curtobacterium aurantiacum TaxID=3236919 RepID=UPI001BE10F0C|nr:DUF6264 family protein [Curtobacterium flaccumfaciens]MBT1677039.1 hypothetical protein [Curtobacterium flaccumfaciens pv. flaccumfaciens]
MGAPARQTGPAPGPGAGAGLDPLGSGPARFGREARHPLAGRSRVADVVASTALLVLLTVEALAAGWGIKLMSLAFVSCAAPGNTCNETLGDSVVVVGPILVAGVLVATIAVCVLRLVRRRLTWPVVLVGMAAVVAVFFASLLLVDSSVTHGI